MKLLTVKEYADKEGIKIAAAYKRIKVGTAPTEKKFGRILIKVK